MLGANDLAVKRGARVVVTGASLQLQTATLTAICGPNGAGKSSLLAALAGLLIPAAGSVTLDEVSLRSLTPRERARRIGFLPQQAEAAWDIDVATLVALGRLPWQPAPGRRTHSDPAADDAEVAGAIQAMQLESLVDRPLSRLSGGERSRAMMARVLAGNPRWILADEPLASLDLAHRQSLCTLLREQARVGRGVVVVMHDLATAMNYADRVVVMNHARIHSDGPPEMALSSQTIADVWGVQAHWLGDPGSRALATA